MNITYCVTVCNELTEIVRLINFLQPKLVDDDEILIQYDTTNTTEDVKQYLSIITGFHSNIRVIDFPLNGDFASFKNNLKQNAKGIYIFQIDADEMPAEYLIDSMHDILDNNPDVDVFYVPRINTVDGITINHIQKWGWQITKFDNIVDEKIMDTDSDEYGVLKHYGLIIDENTTDDDKLKVMFNTPIINFPDYQSRIYKRTSEIQWVNKVHEVVIGFNTLSVIPSDTDYCLYHPKEIERQERQNELYNTIK
jgi:hypothetical protein